MIKASQIPNFIIEPILKPMRIERKIVNVRKVLNKIMRNPIRYQHITIPTRTVRSEYLINEANSIGVSTKVNRLKAKIVTRIETYQNKQVVFVFTNVSHNYLKPYKKTMHN